MTNLYTVSSSAHLLDDVIAFIVLTIDVCRVSVDISILSDNNQNHIMIQKLAAVNWDDFQKVIDIGIVNLSVSDDNMQII